LKCTVSNACDTSRERNTAKIGTVSKCIVPYACDARRYRDIAKTVTTAKRTLPNACQTDRYCDTAKTVAFRKCILPNACYTVRYRDAAKMIVVSGKCIAPYACDTGRNNNAGDRVPELESVCTNSSDRYTSDSRRNADIIAACRIIPRNGSAGFNEGKIFFQGITLRPGGHNRQEG